MRQDFTIAGPFGKLSGVINLCEEELGRRHVLVMAHGFRGSMDGAGRAAALADEIGENICSVVRFNFSWCTMLSNQVAELKAVLGRSFGGATCIVTACGGENAYRPYGMILWSAPNSLKQTFIQVLGEDAFQEALQGKTIVLDDERGHDEIPAAFVTDLFHYDVAEFLKKWKKGPLLIIHGENDTTVTPDQAKENFEIAGGEKQLHYMEGDNHHLDLRFKEAGELVKSWLKKNI